MDPNEIEKITNAIFYEGYLLYPYRASAIKNQYRWTFGTIFPESCAEIGERSWIEAQCLIQIDEASSVQVQLRFLHLYRPNREVSWEESIECQFTTEFSARKTNETSQYKAFVFPGRRDLQQKTLAGELSCQIEKIRSQIYKLKIRVLNKTPLSELDGKNRQVALLSAFASAHLLLTVQHGSFLSQLEPPLEFSDATACCISTGVFPVLIGSPGDTHRMLCSPIVLYDYPQIAPETTGDFFDGTEIDELLCLRVRTLSEEEKIAIRNGDLKAQKILDSSEALSGEQLQQLHGTYRFGPSIQHAQSLASISKKEIEYSCILKDLQMPLI
jgi:hypothetical protein